MQRTRRAIELALSFRTPFNPAEPINISAVSGIASIAEGAPFMVVPVKLRGQTKLSQVAEADRLARFVFGLGQRGQEQRSEDRYNRDHNQQFHQRKTSLCLRCDDLL